MEPIRKEQRIAAEAVREAAEWKTKYIEISKEIAKLKRNQSKVEEAK